RVHASRRLLARLGGVRFDRGGQGSPSVAAALNQPETSHLFMERGGQDAQRGGRAALVPSGGRERCLDQAALEDLDPLPEAANFLWLLLAHPAPPRPVVPALAGSTLTRPRRSPARGSPPPRCARRRGGSCGRRSGRSAHRG